MTAQAAQRQPEAETYADEHDRQDGGHAADLVILLGRRELL